MDWRVFQRPGFGVGLFLVLQNGLFGCAAEADYELPVGFDSQAQASRCEEAVDYFNGHFCGEQSAADPEVWCTNSWIPEDELDKRALFLTALVEALTVFEALTDRRVHEYFEFVQPSLEYGSVVISENLWGDVFLHAGPLAMDVFEDDYLLQVPTKYRGTDSHENSYLQGQEAINFMVLSELLRRYEQVEGRFGKPLAKMLGYNCESFWYPNCNDNPETAPTLSARLATGYERDLSDSVACIHLDVEKCEDAVTATRRNWIHNSDWFPGL